MPLSFTISAKSSWTATSRIFFGQALDTATAEEIHILEAEKRHLPVTHELVGRYMANRWQLPQSLVDAVGDHHTLALKNSDSSRVVRLVHVADAWCRKLGFGRSGDDQTWSPSPKILSAFGLQPTALEEWRRDIDEEFERAKALLNLID